MPNAPFPCLTCNKGTMHYGIKTLMYSRPKDPRQVVVPDVRGWHCDRCGETVFDKGEGARYAAAIEKLYQGQYGKTRSKERSPHGKVAQRTRV